MAMKPIGCEHRETYLGKGLTEDERVEFEMHCTRCPECRQVVQDERRLDELLTRANTALVLVPAGLIDQIDGQLGRAHRRRVAGWATGLIAAGVLVCVLANRFALQRPAVDEFERHPVAAVSPPPPEQTLDPRPLVQVTFQPSADVIAVPRKTDSPSVTIIWVYPTIKTTQESPPAPSELFQPQERNGI